MSDVTQHVNMTPLTVEDWLLIKTSQTEKARLLKTMIVEFSARLWKWHMLFDFLGIIKPTSFAKRLSGSDRHHSEWTYSNIKSINNLNCSQDGQPGHSVLEWKCFPLILLRLLFANLYAVMTALKMSPALMLFK